MVLTKNFVNYLLEFDADFHPDRIDIKEVKPDDSVFDGHKVFDLYFEGTNFKEYKDYSGPPDFQGLKPTNFGHWTHVFEKCLADLTELSQN